MSAPFYELPLQRLDGSSTDLRAHREHVLLVLNTASRCGFTPQYAALEDLWRRYASRGLVILGFPCNQFGGQEPGGADDIRTFCETSYGVTFPMFDKIDVNGPRAHPLFAALKRAAPGILGTRRIKWNFTKFLVGRGASSVERFAPSTSPEKLVEHIERALADAEPASAPAGAQRAHSST